MTTPDEREAQRAALELGASMLQTGAHLAPGLIPGAPGLLGPALAGAAEILRAAEVAMRDRGQSVADIVAAIKMPRKLDTSFRDDLDERIRDLPEKS